LYCRKYKECKPDIKLKRINSEEKLVQGIAADVIKGGIKRSNSIKKGNKIPGTPPIARPSPRSDAMAAQEAAGAAAWLEVKKIVVSGVKYKRWDGNADPYIEINGMVKTGVAWSGGGGGGGGGGKPLSWTRTDSVIPVSPGDNSLQIRLYDANRLREDILIGECSIETHDVPDMATGPTVIRGTIACPKYGDAKLEIHLLRSLGPSFPLVDEPGIRADHRKVTVDDLDITSDVKKPRDLRDEAKQLAEETEAWEKKQASLPPPKHQPTESAQAWAERKRAQEAPAPAAAKKESKAQPRREAKGAGAAEAKHGAGAGAGVAQAKAGPRGREPRAERKDGAAADATKKHKTRTMSPGWLQKNVEAEKKLVIDDAYSAAFKKIVADEGVFLDFGEITLILKALGYEEAVVPSLNGLRAREDAKAEDTEGPATAATAAVEMEGQRYLEEGIVHIPLSDVGAGAGAGAGAGVKAGTGGTRAIAAVLTELVNKVDFGIPGAAATARRTEGEGEPPAPAPAPAPIFAVSNKQARIVKEHLVGLVTSTWSRNRNFILLVCGAPPEQGGGRPSNWSITWIQKFARKLEFPEHKFMSCGGLQFLEENRNSVKKSFGIIPSLLQSRFALYQHLLRLLEAWWTIPSRPADRVDAQFKDTRRVTAGGYVPFVPPQQQQQQQRATNKSHSKGNSSRFSPTKPEIHRLTLSPTYVKGGRGRGGGERVSEALQPGDSVVIGPTLILTPVLLAAAKDHQLDIRDHMLERYAELVASRSGAVSVFPYGRHDFPGLMWVCLRAEEGEETEDLSKLSRQLTKIDVTDILVSGKHVLVPEVCLMNTYENSNAWQRHGEDNDEASNANSRKGSINTSFATIGYAGDRYVSKAEAAEAGDAMRHSQHSQHSGQNGNTLADRFASSHNANADDTASDHHNYSYNAPTTANAAEDHDQEASWRDDYSDDGRPAYECEHEPAPARAQSAPAGRPKSSRGEASYPAPAPAASPAYNAYSGGVVSPMDLTLRESADGGTGRGAGWETVWSRGGQTGGSLGGTRGSGYPEPGESYLNGGGGVAHAVVTAPVRDPAPNRGSHEKLPGSPPRDHTQGPGAGAGGGRPLYRPMPNMFDTVVPAPSPEEAGGRPRSRSRDRPRSSGGFREPSVAGDHFNEAEAILRGMPSGPGKHSRQAPSMKNDVCASVEQYNRMDDKLRSSMKKKGHGQRAGASQKPRQRRRSFDPLKEPAHSRPKPAEEKKKKKPRAPQYSGEGYASEKDEELRQLIERLENIDSLDELQGIQDSIAGIYRGRTGQAMGSPSKAPKGVHPEGIIDSMIKYKLNHDGDSNSAKMKMKKWGVSDRDKDKEARAAGVAMSDADWLAQEGKDPKGEEVEAPHPLKKNKFFFPWMVGDPRASDDIDPKKNERLWRALKVAERESAKKEAHLRRELRKLGVKEEDVNTNPYDCYTNV
jgi:hypothetical protein